MGGGLGKKQASGILNEAIRFYEAIRFSEAELFRHRFW
jgi:hypothetical protein